MRDEKKVCYRPDPKRAPKRESCSTAAAIRGVWLSNRSSSVMSDDVSGMMIDLELHVAGDAFQDLRDVLESRLAVDRVANRLGLLHEDLVHELVDRVATEQVRNVDGLRLTRTVDAILRLLRRFRAVFEIDEDD